jgi:hypothetical protein
MTPNGADINSEKKRATVTRGCPKRLQEKAFLLECQISRRWGMKKIYRKKGPEKIIVLPIFQNLFRIS